MGLAGTPEVSPGDHACCEFATDDDHARIVGKFARDAVTRRDRMIYLADSTDEAQVIAFLDEVGLDGTAMLDSGALEILHSSTMELDDGFDRARMTEEWKERLAEAQADGYVGLSATAEMTWALSWDLDADALMDYEQVVQHAFTGRRLAGLCQYDGRRFDAGTLERAGHVHRYGWQVDDAGVSIDYNRLHIQLGRELRLGGEIDLANVQFLEQQLTEQLTDGDAVVDVSALTFIDARGCRVLHEATKGFGGTGRLKLRDIPEAVARVMRVYEALEQTR